jgi:hypothetical protein
VSQKAACGVSRACDESAHQDCAGDVLVAGFPGVELLQVRRKTCRIGLALKRQLTSSLDLTRVLPFAPDLMLRMN